MTVFLNGKFVEEGAAVVSVFDRGFLYGDGLFEGMLVKGGKPFGWDEHMERLGQGIEFLKLTVAFTMPELRAWALELIERNGMREGILRLSISRGITGRGYSPRNAVSPAVVMSLHSPANIDSKKMPRWRVITSSFRLSTNDPLTRFKTANKLPQVLARGEADMAGAQEALLLNTDGLLAEGTTSNIFWIQDSGVCTPPLPAGALPGITRRFIIDLCVTSKIPWREKSAKPEALRRAEGAFLTLTSMGVVEIESLDGRKLKRSPLVKKLWRAYGKLLDSFC